MTLENLNNIQIRDAKINEYRIVYLWGAWVSHKKIFAESDAEAIFDSDEIFDGVSEDKKQLFKWALVRGNRFVKRY